MLLAHLGLELPDTDFSNNLDLSDLYIEYPQIGSYKIFDFILNRLLNAMNSLIFISDDIHSMKNYINSLSALLKETNRLENELRRITTDLEVNVEERITRLAGKKLHTFSFSKLLDLGTNSLDWIQIFEDVTVECVINNYYLVNEDLELLFKVSNKDKDIANLSRKIYDSTRGKSKVTFIYYTNWLNYSQHIEHGLFPAVLRSWTPIFFTPRPSYLLQTQISPLSIEKHFKFI